MANGLTLNGLKHHSFDQYVNFKSLYKKLFFKEKLHDEDINKILSIIVIFNLQSESLIKMLGYRMALAYGIKTSDLKPLYDIAINSGLMPIVSLIKNLEDISLDYHQKRKDSFMSNIVDSYIDNFRNEKIVSTEQQHQLNGFFNSSLSDSTTIIAPTSYGKSELIISAIRILKNKNICVLVPSKSLLSQTRKRVVDAKINWISRIVSHPEMHKKNDESSVYILTQERLTRILNQDNKIYFDVVIVDEAHNLLNKDARNILLASLIRILEFRNKNTAFKFLTPFLKDSSSLKIRNCSYRALDYKVNEYVKSELLFIADYRAKRKIFEFYDHFIHEYIELKNKSNNCFEYILENSENKNIIFFNKPKDIQSFAKKLTDFLPKVKFGLIEEAILEIGAYTNEAYLLLQCMKHGVLYHHGSMNEPIRNYVEYLYRTCSGIKYLVSNSTLLEGVNLPIEKMFILSISKGQGYLKPSQFKNLIGRVNRFSEIFNNPELNSIKKLQPEIHILGTDEYLPAKADLRGFIEKVMENYKKDKDLSENVLLSNTKINAENKKEYERIMTRLENMEEGISGAKYEIASTDVGLKLLENNIIEIDVFKCEKSIERVLINYSKNYEKINSSRALMSLIYKAFVSFIDPEKKQKYFNLMRLENESTQNFYSMLLDWKMEKVSLPFMINKFTRYWEGLTGNRPIYIGRWGDTTYNDGIFESYTFINKKTKDEKINLAIVRIKEEEDFFDYVIFRFVEILNELDYLDETFYKYIKYGTADKNIITLIKNGFSRGVAEMLIEKYIDFIDFEKQDNVVVDSKIHQQLKDDNVGFLQRYEIQLNVAEF